ncbi:PepSY domain-containing protein [Chryseobacterium sp. NEB161]|nr:PepSY domain-containing protein [Chryseobacterium sp. NEB161]
MNKSNNPKKRKGKSLFSRFVAWVHLWPSIVSGIILVFVCLTGTIIVYCDEIMDFSAGEARYVQVPANPQRISAVQLAASLKKSNPDFSVSEYVFFKDPHRSIRVRAFIPKDRKLVQVYVNPYTGKVIKVDRSIYFFFVTAHLHSSLLAGKAGGWVVAVSTIIFVISTITGLILWWPKKWTRATKEASFTIRWKARFKRLNYDLHNVFGFYSLIICFILGLTGLIIFFHPMMEATVKLTGGDPAPMETLFPQYDSTQTDQDLVAIGFAALDKKFGDKKMISIWLESRNPSGAFVYRSGIAGLKSNADTQWYIVNRYTGDEITVPKASLQHEKTENAVWQLHMGQWLGQLGKLTTFLSGIIATTLPVTGFLIWWGRRKKSKKKSKEIKKVHQHRTQVYE